MHLSVAPVLQRFGWVSTEDRSPSICKENDQCNRHRHSLRHVLACASISIHFIDYYLNLLNKTNETSLLKATLLVTLFLLNKLLALVTSVQYPVIILANCHCYYLKTTIKSIV